MVAMSPPYDNHVSVYMHLYYGVLKEMHQKKLHQKFSDELRWGSWIEDGMMGHV